MMELKNTQIASVVMVVLSIIKYMNHKKKNYEGEYKADGSYDNITAVKHDMTKALFIELFMIAMLGLSGERFYDSENILNSWVGKTMVILASYFVYYQLVQPYVINKMPNF